MSVGCSLHCHSVYSDGENSLEEMVEAALRKGLTSLGFSEHAWTPYDDCCIKQQSIAPYCAHVQRLKESFADKIELYLGFESDSFYPASKHGLDFTIGSVHYLLDQEVGAYYPFDYKPELFERCRDKIAGGDIRTMVALYYDQVAHMAETYRPDIVGHLDLIVKLNRGGRFFDEDSGWYHALAASAVQRIAKTGCIVEVNTGGIQRGYRGDPYPSSRLLGQLRELGVPVIISSDAHSAEAVDFGFTMAADLLRCIGYRTVKELHGGRFVDAQL